MSQARIAASTPAATNTTISPGQRQGEGPDPDRRRPAHRPDGRGCPEQLARDRLAAARDEHVARAGGQEIGHVEAAGAARERRHARLQQQALEQLGLGLVAGRGDTHELALGVGRMDLAGAVAQRVGRRRDGGARVDER